MVNNKVEDETVAYRRIKKPVSLKQRIYNREDKTCCGRQCVSWLKLLAFYVVFYVALISMLTAMLFSYLATFSDDVPVSDMLNPIIVTPGLTSLPGEVAFRVRRPVIKFNPTDTDTFEEYRHSLAKFLRLNTNELPLTMYTCASVRIDGQCNLEKALYGECNGETDASFGYADGSPCVLLKLNKIRNWYPVDFDSVQDDPLLTDATGSRYQRGAVTVSCENSLKADGAPTWSVEFFPRQGFAFNCFPFCNTEYDRLLRNEQRRTDRIFHQPVVMAKFSNLTRNTKITIWCKAWAKNLIWDKKDQAASATLVLYVAS